MPEPKPAKVKPALRFRVAPLNPGDRRFKDQLLRAVCVVTLAQNDDELFRPEDVMCALAILLCAFQGEKVALS